MACGSATKTRNIFTINNQIGFYEFARKVRRVPKTNWNKKKQLDTGKAITKFMHKSHQNPSWDLRQQIALCKLGVW